MTDLTMVTYCGLYCGLCSSRKRIPEKAQDLKNIMAEEGYDTWGTDIPGFKNFWEFLTNLCHPETSCAGCRQGGGPPFCSIRRCSKEKDIDVCPYCEEYPCSKIEELGKGYPTLIADGKRMKQIGIDQWIEEQKKRENTPFVYSDIRCYPYSVPED